MIEVTHDKFTDLEFGEPFMIVGDSDYQIYTKIDSDLYVKGYYTCEYIRKSELGIFPDTFVERV